MNKTLYSVIILLIVGGVIWWAFPSQNEDGVACTADAMQCPDGSYVGRTGPKCEFSPCPGPVFDASWETSTQSGMTFRYPKNLGTTYIQTVDWPPSIQIVDGPFECAAAGTPEARTGQTEERTISARNYCVTQIVEGAAGSTYTQYAYATAYGDKTAIFTFTTRASQCANYDEPRKSGCETERSMFNLDALVDQIAQSLAEQV